MVYWGDFNVTFFLDKRLRGTAHRSAVVDFADFVAEQSLVDLPLEGGDVTWSNSVSWLRLDQFLVSPEWEFSYPGLMQKKLFRGLLGSCADSPCQWVPTVW